MSHYDHDRSIHEITSSSHLAETNSHKANLLEIGLATFLDNAHNLLTGNFSLARLFNSMKNDKVIGL